MIITVNKAEHHIDASKVEEFIASLKKGTAFSVRETLPDKTYERTYIK